MHIRFAAPSDIPAVAAIYDAIHTAEEQGRTTIGWIRGVYPTRHTAEAALARGDLFVAEAEGQVVGTAIINQQQVDAYHGAPWHCPAPDSEVMVLHTLVIAPSMAGRGYGKEFVAFYEEFARAQGCRALRMDTNTCNTAARAMYKKLGYAEIGIVPCVFNGIDGVQLVLLEKGMCSA